MPVNVLIDLPNSGAICRNINDIINLDNKLYPSYKGYHNPIEKNYGIIHANSLFEYIKLITNIKGDFRLLINGNEVYNNNLLIAIQLLDFIRLTVLYKLLGGKGGFGASLRGAKGRKKTSFNIDSCRDLNGIRIRNTRIAEQINKWKEAGLTPEQLEILKTSSSYPTTYPDPITNSKGHKVPFSLKERRRRLISKLDDSYVNKKDSAVASIAIIESAEKQGDDKNDVIVTEDFATIEPDPTACSSRSVPRLIEPCNAIKANNISLGAKLIDALINN